MILPPLSPRGRRAGGEGAARHDFHISDCVPRANALGSQCECRLSGKTKRWAYVGITILVLYLSSGCDRPTTASPPVETQPAAATPAVHTVNPERKTVHHRIDQPGFNIQAFQQSLLYPKITGYIQKWNVDIGDRVQQGDILAVLYVPEMKEDVNRKQAAVRQAAAQIEQAKATVLTAEAQRDRFKSQSERLARIGRAGVLDQESVDETRLSYESAKAALVKAKADVLVAQAQHEVAQADLAFARTMLDYATIRAPFDGVVTRRNINTGDLVQPAAGGMKAQALYVVEQIDPVRVFVNVPGADAPWIKEGDPVTLELEGAGGAVIQAKVTRNARSLDPQNRTLNTEIDLPNPRGNLLPGMYVQSRITVERKDAWTLPESALTTEADQTICYRIEDGKAVKTPLQVGLKGGGRVEILMQQTPASLSGGELEWTPITGEEKIVAGDIASLTNGKPVQATPATPAAAAGK
jgi:HlyD family secretion protein